MELDIGASAFAGDTFCWRGIRGSFGTSGDDTHNKDWIRRRGDWTGHTGRMLAWRWLRAKQLRNLYAYHLRHSAWASRLHGTC